MNFSMNKPTFGSNPFGSANTAAAATGMSKPFGMMSSAAPTSFGMNNQTNPSGNMFGASTAVGNAFQPANTFAAPAANPFGMNTSTGFGAAASTGGSNPFGSLASPSTQSSMGAFGGSNPSGGMFGSSNPSVGAFGSSNPSVGAFGSSNPTGGMFGGSLTAPNSGFNQSSPSSGLFGGNKSAFPTSSTITNNLSGLVGAAPWGTAGAGSGSPFGSAAAAKPNTAPFGSNPFGASPSGTSLSGFTGGMGMGGSNAGLLGGGASSFGGGAFSAQQQGGFNTTTAASPFGQQAPFGMGATAGASSSSSGLGGFMGSGNAVFGQQQQQVGGTGNPPFQPLEVKDTVANGRGGSQQTTLKLQSICGMNQYNSKSLEELRLEDYSRNNRGGPSKNTTTGMLGGGGGMLGGGGAMMGGNVFGAKPATVGGFGSSNLFGTSAAPAQQQQQPSVGIFGAPQQQQQQIGGGVFGNQATTPSPFGQSTNTFSGTGTGAGAGMGFNFGATNPAQNIFGGAASNQQLSSGLFSTAASQQQQPPALFSASSSSSQQPNGFNFGSSNTGLSAPTSFNSFGSLGTQQQQQQPGSMSFGASINPTAATGSNMFNFGNAAATGGSSNMFSSFSSANNNKINAPTAMTNTPLFNSSFSSFAKPIATTQPLNFSSGFTGFNGAPGSSSSFNQQNNPGAPFMPQQQQFTSQFTSQFQQPQPSMQQQQQHLQQLDVAGRIDLLKKKEEEIRSSLKEQSKSLAAAAAAAVSSELKQVPNLFSGFIGGKASHQKPLSSHYSPAANSHYSTVRLLPRGMRTAAPMLDDDDDDVTAASTQMMGSAASPRKAMSSMRPNESILLSPAASATSVGSSRNTKRLLILSAITSPQLQLPDPTEDLPRAPSSTANANANAATSSMSVSMNIGQQTPSSMNNNNSSSAMMMRVSQDTSIVDAGHSSSSSKSIVPLGSSSSSSSTARSGDATGLTPAASAAIGTPFHVVDGRKGGAQNQSETAVGTVTTPISFHLMPSSSSSSSGRGTEDFRRLLSHEKKTTNGDEDADADDRIHHQQQQQQQSVAPTLKRVDYCCTPDISVLQRLPADDLARIHQFTVTRPGYGKIVWAGETDVRGLDLDAIITIGRSEVGLYENNSSTPPPSVGSELNKRATITLHNVFPKQGSTDRKKQEFDRKLRDYCLSSGAQFIAYDRTTGSWEFEVQHFSRYGLMDSDDDDDDDEEDDPTGPVEERKEPSSAHRSTRPAAAAATTTKADSHPYDSSSFITQEQQLKGSTTAMTVSENIRQLRQLLVSRDEGAAAAAAAAVVGAEDSRGSNGNGNGNGLLRGGGVEEEEEEEDDVHTRFVGDMPPTHRRRLADGVTLKQQQQKKSIALKRSMPCSVPSLEMLLRSMQTMRGDAVFQTTATTTATIVRNRVESEKAFQPIHQSPSMVMMMRVKRAAAEATGVAVDCIGTDYTRASLGSSDLRSVSSLQRGMQHYSLSMSRSFRVGWSSDGRIAHPGGRMMMMFSNGSSTTASLISSSIVSVERVDPLRWMKTHYDLNCNSTATLYDQPLSAILKGSHQRRNTATPSSSSSFSMTAAGTESIRRIAPAVFSLPLWSPPAADPLQLHEYIPFLIMLQGVIGSFSSRTLKTSHPDWVTAKAMELINATIGQESSSSSSSSSSTLSSDESLRAAQLMPLYEDRGLQLRPEFWERRREAQSRWMEEVTAPAVTYAEDTDSGVYGQSDATFTRLFDLLSCHRISDAVSLAEGADMFRLAALLTQLDGDSSLPTLLRSQLEVWAASGADATIPIELLKVYRLIAGSVVIDGPEQPESSLQGLGWERAVGMLFWYCSSTDSSSSSSSSSADDVSTLSSALDSYRIVLQDSFADPPLSPHVHDRDPLGACVSYPMAQHGLYSLLTLLFPITGMVTASSSSSSSEERELELGELLLRALAPSGYTRDELDHRASYLLLVFLECAGLSDIDSTHGRIVRLHYIYQLLGEGMWLWAIFVALQISDVSIRYALTRDIIFRFGPIETTMAEDDIANYLRQLNVPVSLFYEAKAYFFGCCQGDYRQEVSYLIHAGQLHTATEKAVHYIVPMEILASGDDGDASRKLLDLLELIITAPEEGCGGSVYCDYWSNLGHIFLTFLRLKHSIEGDRGDGGDGGGKDTPVQWAASDMYEEALELLNRLSAFAAASDSASSDSRSQQQLLFNSSERQRMDVVLFDVSTYVHRVLQGLETAVAATSSGGGEGGGGVMNLIAPQYLKQLPLFSERVASSVRASNSRYLRAASVELVSCFSDYFDALPMT